MNNISHDHQESQEAVYHFWPDSDFTKACLVIRDDPLRRHPPAGSTLIKTDTGTGGHLDLFLLEEFFNLFPNARNQPKRVILSNPLYGHPDTHGNHEISAYVILSHPIPEEDPEYLSAAPGKKQLKPATVRHDKAPQDVLNYFAYLNDKHKWTKVFKATCNESVDRPLRTLQHWRGKKDRMARVYLKGIENLSDKTGIPTRTIKRARALMRAERIIRHRGAGIKGTGYAIHEVPRGLSHVMAWRKDPTL